VPSAVWKAILIVLSLGLLAPVSPRRPTGAHPGDADRVRPNDNREPGGILREGTLSSRLEARVATWHPNAEDAPGVEMPAFAEEGGAAQIPGPLIRVPAGTEVEVSVRNPLADTLRVHGLYAQTRATAKAEPPLALAPGKRRALRFRLEAPGTYHY
jgi:manganese oxidase